MAHKTSKGTFKKGPSSNSTSGDQVGGACGSDFSGLWHSWEISPAELSRITLERIDCAPMFNPLRKGTIFPTGTSGITPTGVYLANTAPYNDSCVTVECMSGRNLPRNTTAAADVDILAGPVLERTAGDAPVQTGGGLLSNGLGYGPYCTTCRCSGPCRCRRGAYGEPVRPRGRGGRGASRQGGRRGRGPRLGCGGRGIRREPVYFSETSSPEGCTSRCRMPPACYATSNIGCKSLAESGVKNVDYETYLHLKAADNQERIDTMRKCYCGKCNSCASRCRPPKTQCGVSDSGCPCASGSPCWYRGTQ